MAWFKRVSLFLLVNFLVVTTLSLLMNLLGVRPYLDARGIDYRSLLAFCLVWGMGGAFVSLALSRQMAKWLMHVRVIDPDAADPTLRGLVAMVHRLCHSAGLTTMPEVGLYESPEVNAFATGPTRSRSLVAVSTGLLHRMDREEVEGVLGHEVSHIANGDMVTMTLLQGIVNAFVMFLARVIAFALAAGRGERDDRGGFSYGTYLLVQFFLQFVFMILGSMVVAWYSRYREYRADAGGAGLAGRPKMIRALEALRKVQGLVDPRAEKPALDAFKISGKNAGWLRFFSTHPPLEDRIRRLEESLLQP